MPDSSGVKIHGSIERTTIDKLVKEYGVPKAQAQKLAHIMAENYAKEKGIPFDDLNHVQPNDMLKFRIDPNNIANSKIIELDRVSGISGHHSPNIGGHGPSIEQPIITPEEDLSNIDDVQDAGSVDQVEPQGAAVEVPVEPTGPTPEEIAEFQRVHGNNGAEILRNIHSMPKFAQMFEGKMLHAGELKLVAEQAYERALADTNDISGAGGKRHWNWPIKNI